MVVAGLWCWSGTISAIITVSECVIFRSHSVDCRHSRSPEFSVSSRQEICGVTLAWHGDLGWHSSFAFDKPKIWSDRPTMNILLAFLIINTVSRTFSTKLLKRELQGYPLAKCNDGTTAGYFYDQVREGKIYHNKILNKSNQFFCKFSHAKTQKQKRSSLKYLSGNIWALFQNQVIKTHCLLQQLLKFHEFFLIIILTDNDNDNGFHKIKKWNPRL